MTPLPIKQRTVEMPRSLFLGFCEKETFPVEAGFEVAKMEQKKSGPMMKKQIGRFQVSIWKRRKVVPAKNDFGVEREVDIVRACVQYSRCNRQTGAWERQQIWCEPEELRSLVQVLDQLGGDAGGDGNE